MMSIKRAWSRVLNDMAEALFELRSSTHDVFIF